MSAAAEITGKALGGVADGRPLVAGQINVPGQQALDAGRRALVHRLGEPRQLRAGADLVYIVFVLRGFLCLLTVPGALHCLLQHNGNGQHAILHTGRAGGVQSDGTCAADIPLRLDIVVIGVIEQVLVNAVLGGKLRTVGVCQGNGRVLDGRAVFIHNV